MCAAAIPADHDKRWRDNFQEKKNKQTQFNHVLKYYLIFLNSNVLKYYLHKDCLFPTFPRTFISRILCPLSGHSVQERKWPAEGNTREVTEMVGLEHFPFGKSLGQLGLLSLEPSWPWGDLTADPSAMGKSLRRHSQAFQSNASWKDEKQEV